MPQETECKGVSPMSVSTFTFAPRSRSSRAITTFPLWAARCNGVQRSLRRAFTSAPDSSNSCATRAPSSRDLYMLHETECKGVSPISVSAFDFAPRSRRSRTIATLPLWTAICNGVQRSLRRAFTSAPHSNNSRATRAPSS
ncbi:hypothetical protein EDB87DRAFT_1610410 [Lactarius vividus]|nr:hypothetical protein EDB87DRAFT_1610410 [Lactarius vividus]